ncbi:hypothetical protein [Paenibacillus sp. CF384]|uniref:glycoside hydrolase family 130 protein n=1 Tax=Paenibacillus sp. CF384 TaxID=1884382 RepID=UPI00089CC65C|nr:hypothetical protein [Paenibacillus sp. CF384]SDW31600.1 protein of unknown function [Paenibacillus sp. CF384]
MKANQVKKWVLLFISTVLMTGMFAATATAGANPWAGGDIVSLSVTNDASGTANKYIYKRISNKAYTFVSGDYIEYDVKISNGIDGAGGIEIMNTDGTYFRDTGSSVWKDQNNISGHPNANISAYATNKWYHRKLAVPASMIGKTSSKWDIVGENDSASQSYSAQYDNLKVTNGITTTKSIVFVNASDFNSAATDIGPAAVSTGNVTTSNIASNMSHLMDNQAFIKLDKINPFIGTSFSMHFISTLKVNGEIWAYYIKWDAFGKGGVGLAKSTDGVNFTDNGFVLTAGSPGQWDDSFATFPGMWYDGGTFYLVYEGTGTGSPGQIGLATSTDGVNFTKQGQILTHNSSGWESVNIGTPSLYKEGSTWYLFYHGYDGSDCRIGVATGTSLTSLTKYSGNPVIDTEPGTWEAGTAGHRDIVKVGSTYYMTYEGSEDPPYNTAKWSSGVASSTDLVHWSKFSQNHILPQTDNTFGNDGPSFLSVDGENFIYYRTNPTSRALIANESDGGFDLKWGMADAGIGHVIGRTDGDGWSASTSLDGPDYMQYGPYTTNTPVGDNIATWKMMVDSNSGTNDVIRLEVVDADDSGAVIASRVLQRNDWKQTNRYEYFSVPFHWSAGRSGHRIELRAHWYDSTYVKMQLVGVS